MRITKNKSSYEQSRSIEPIKEVNEESFVNSVFRLGSKTKNCGE